MLGFRVEGLGFRVQGSLRSSFTVLAADDLAGCLYK